MARAAPSTAALAEAIDALLPQTQCASAATPDAGLTPTRSRAGPPNRPVPSRRERSALPTSPRSSGCRRSRWTRGSGAAGARRRSHRRDAPASAARCASRPVRSMPSSARRSSCTRSIRDACTGCELCVPPCPVDCIRLLEIPPLAPDSRRGASDPRAWALRSAQPATRARARSEAQHSLRGVPAALTRKESRRLPESSSAPATAGKMGWKVAGSHHHAGSAEDWWSLQWKVEPLPDATRATVFLSGLLRLSTGFVTYRLPYRKVSTVAALGMWLYRHRKSNQRVRTVGSPYVAVARSTSHPLRARTLLSHRLAVVARGMPYTLSL